MTDDLARQLRLTTSRTAYRRAGLAIGSAAAPTILTPEQFEELGHERQAKLFADPAIEIAASDDGITFKRISAEVRAEAVGLYHEFMTGEAEGEETHSPTPQSHASMVPGAAAATGDVSKTGLSGELRSPAEERQPAADPAPAPVAASLSNSVNPMEATGDDAKGAAAASIGDDRNADVEKPGVDAATAPVASDTTAKSSGRAPKAAKPKVPEAKAAS